MSELFAPVDTAAATFDLASQDPLGLSRYPGTRLWDQAGDLDPAFHVLVDYFEAANGLLLRGLPGAGKTFAALQFGHAWETRRQPRGRPNRYARYTLAQKLTPASLEELWSATFPPGEFLWIIDDIHEVSAIAPEIVALFRHRLEPLGHRLLLVGWQVPDGISPFPTVDAGLTEGLIQRALDFRALPVPSPRARRQLVSSRTVGLRVILAIATYQPDLLERGQPVDALRIWVDHLLHRLGSADAAAMLDLATDLAVLRFLGLDYFPVLSVEELRLVTRLQDVGLALKHPGGSWQLVDDERARALLLLDDASPRLANSFFERLLRMARRQPRLSAPILRRLRGRSAAALGEWVGSSLQTDAGNLLAALEAYAPSESIATMCTTTIPLAEVANAVEVLRDSRVVARQVLEARDVEILALLPLGDVRVWDGTRRLSVLAGTSKYDRHLDHARRAPTFGGGTENALGTTRDALLRSLATEGRQAEGDGRLLAELVRRRYEEGDTSAWRLLERVAHHHRSLAREALDYLDGPHLMRALLTAPFRFLSFLGRVGRHKGIHARLERESTHTPLLTAYLEGWRARDVESFSEFDHSSRLGFRERALDALDPEDETGLLQIAMLGASFDRVEVTRRLAESPGEHLARALTAHPDVAQGLLGLIAPCPPIVQAFRSALDQHPPSPGGMAAWPEWRLHAYANLGRRIGATSGHWARRRLALRPSSLWATVQRDLARGVRQPLQDALPREVVTAVFEHPDQFLVLLSDVGLTAAETIIKDVSDALDAANYRPSGAGMTPAPKREAFMRAAKALRRPSLLKALSQPTPIATRVGDVLTVAGEADESA